MPTLIVPCRRAGPRMILPDHLDSGLRRSISLPALVFPCASKGPSPLFRLKGKRELRTNARLATNQPLRMPHFSEMGPCLRRGTISPGADLVPDNP
ncbi:MAG: hypothetical protein ACI9KA_001826 [Parasphingorhabdus sp.]|jgi:hypothetical protein